MFYETIDTALIDVESMPGKWKYLEHDWIGTPGSFVFETAA